ncbi:MAG: hypothetical protein M1821_002033 [Bathelium mastoideum]|nr:MAG: hypothetical protein M1821_002033 [Bathelium mastoideum]KAI9692540.1 MAG: hypothetical protein M1822_006771 [Bathelium mastoideum]
MATRRKPANANGAIPNSTSTPPLSPNTAPPTALSTFIPTSLEAALLSIYPATLLLGSLFSLISPQTRNAPYSSASQSHPPHLAPSYFARKSNIFNLYFVKVGWLWTTAALLLFVLSHPFLGPPLRPVLTRRRARAALRYFAVSTAWLLTTQWCFGPPLIDRGFRFTGGVCEVPTVADAEVGGGKGTVGEQLTHAACRLAGGQWKGGHDISGHVFLLILGSAMLWLEVLPVVLRWAPGLREGRVVVKTDGTVVTVAAHSREEARTGLNGQDAPKGTEAATSFGVKLALGVAGFSWWMLLMTAAYFHTWFEKFTGLLVAFTGIYLVYFLPRAVPVYRAIIGMPGV